MAWLYRLMLGRDTTPNENHSAMGSVRLDLPLNEVSVGQSGAW